VYSGGDKAYTSALIALKQKDYTSASKFFQEAAPYYKDDKEFKLYFETTQLLIEVKKTLGKLEDDEKLEIEEIFTNG